MPHEDAARAAQRNITQTLRGVRSFRRATYGVRIYCINCIVVEILLVCDALASQHRAQAAAHAHEHDARSSRSGMCEQFAIPFPRFFRTRSSSLRTPTADASADGRGEAADGFESVCSCSAAPCAYYRNTRVARKGFFFDTRIFTRIDSCFVRFVFANALGCIGRMHELTGRVKPERPVDCTHVHQLIGMIPTWSRMPVQPVRFECAKLNMHIVAVGRRGF